MIRVVGKLPSSIDLSKVDSEGTLCLMFEGMPLDIDIFELDPTSTYIVTDRQRELMSEYLERGFYCLNCNVKYFDLTYEMLYGFMLTDYATNGQIYKANRLHELYVSRLDLFDAIITIFMSLRNRDSDTFYQTVKYNLNPVIDGLNDIRSIIEFSKDMTNIQGKFRALEVKIQELTQTTKLVNPEALQLAQEALRNIQINLDKKQQEIRILEEDNRALTSKVSGLTATSSEVVPVVKYNQLLADKQMADSQLSVLRSEKDALTARLASIKDVQSAAQPTDAFGSEAMIKSLKAELELTKSVSPAEKVYGMLPIITDSMSVKTQYILQFKEIKPTIYINSLLYWTSLVLKSAMIREARKAPIIVIFDNLMDQYRIQKYRKHGYSINQVPTAPNIVTVTNDLSLLFLKETLQIQKYDFVMIIDRLGSIRSVAKSDKTITYYFVDSPEDITDYNLDPQACIGFYKPDGTCKYFTEPSAEIAQLRGDKRVARIGQNGWMNEILGGLRIIEGK